MKYSEGYLLDDRYRLERFIGSGTFGEVWVAMDRATDIEVAIKVYVSMDEKGLEEFKKEFQISFELNHSNLLHANYLGVNPEDKRPFLVMPYCPEGSVSKFAGQMSEEDLWRFIRDVASGLAYLHSQQPPIIHQDIKPDNILIMKNGDFVVTDFGISKQLRATLRKSAVSLNSAGAISYMGPERFSKQYQAVKASDVWSLGVSIFELATNEMPFCGMGGSLLKQGAEIPDLPDDFSPMLNMVCQSCLAKETWDRPTAQQLADFAAKILNGDSPRPAWLASAAAPVCPDPQPVVVEPVAFEQPAPTPAPTPAPAPAPLQQTVMQAAPVHSNPGSMANATVAMNSEMPTGETPVIVPAPKENVFGVMDQKEANDSFGPLVWVLTAVAGLGLGILLNLFI